MPYSGQWFLSMFRGVQAPEPIVNKTDRRYILNMDWKNIY